MRAAAIKHPPAEIAALFSELSAEQQAPLFRVLPREIAADTFEYLPLHEQEELLKGLGQEDVAAILNEMSDDDRTRLLEELPASATRQMLALLDEKECAIASRSLGSPEGSVGRLMTPHYIALRPEWTVQQSLAHIRAHGQDSETLNLVYVVDNDGKLIDDIRDWPHSHSNARRRARATRTTRRNQCSRRRNDHCAARKSTADHDSHQHPRTRSRRLCDRSAKPFCRRDQIAGRLSSHVGRNV